MKHAEDQPRLYAAILRVPRLQMLRDVMAPFIGAYGRGPIARRRRAARKPSYRRLECDKICFLNNPVEPTIPPTDRWLASCFIVKKWIRLPFPWEGNSQRRLGSSAPQIINTEWSTRKRDDPSFMALSGIWYCSWYSYVRSLGYMYAPTGEDTSGIVCPSE